MTNSTPDSITQLLLAWRDGDESALDKLTPLVHKELHRMASSFMMGERAGHTLQTTGLINEAYLRLMDWRSVEWQNRAHFLAVCAKLMRRVLVDYARTRNFAKRQGKVHRVSLDEAMVVSGKRDVDLEALDEALQNLASFDLRKSQIVELRFFGGLSVQETAEALRLSIRTIQNEWSLAKAWLYSELSQN